MTQRNSAVRDLTVGSPMKLVLGFAAPLLFGFLFQQLYSFVDTAIVGHTLGADMLAAVGSTASINFFVLGFCNGLCAGFSIPIAQAFGAKEEGELRQLTAQAAYLCAGLSVLLAGATAALTEPIMRLLGTDARILPDAVRYIRIIFLAIPFTMLYNMAGGVLRALGDSRTPVIFLAVASVMNIVLDVVFILACGMSVEGAALATAVSQLAAGLGCVAVMIRRFPILHLSREERRWRPTLARHLMGVGAPMGLQYSITAIGSILVTWSVNGLSVNAVAAVTAGGKLSMFFCCMFDALATAMATFAGQNMGARRMDRVGQGLRAASEIGTVYCLLALGAILLFGHTMIGLFIDPAEAPEVTEMAAHYLKMNALFYIPLLFVNIVRLSIQGMGFTRVAMLAGLCEMAARAVVAVFVVPALAFDGACLANPAAWICADLFLFPCYFHLMRKLRLRLTPGTVRESVPVGREELPVV